MYKYILTYKLAPKVTEEKLLSIAKKLVNSYMKNQKGSIQGKNVQRIKLLY